MDAKHILNTYSQKEIADLLFCYGDFKNSRKIAEKIVKERGVKKITYTDQFSTILKDFYVESNKNKFLARVFQALRIEVNDEINALKELLELFFNNVKKPRKTGLFCHIIQLKIES